MIECKELASHASDNAGASAQDKHWIPWVAKPGRPFATVSCVSERPATLKLNMESTASDAAIVNGTLEAVPVAVAVKSDISDESRNPLLSPSSPVNAPTIEPSLRVRKKSKEIGTASAVIGPASSTVVTMARRFFLTVFCSAR